MIKDLKQLENYEEVRNLAFNITCYRFSNEKCICRYFLNGTIACIRHFGGKKILNRFHPIVQKMENL